jgi:hypothetical protein
MPAGRYNIVCEQGATFRLDMKWTDEKKRPMSLIGWTGRMQVRETVQSVSSVIDLTSPAGIEFPGGGQVRLNMSATVTAALPVGRFVYDLELVSPSGEVVRLIEGFFTIKPEVTR